jgi:hypothetical protein
MRIKTSFALLLGGTFLVLSIFHSLAFTQDGSNLSAPAFGELSHIRADDDDLHFPGNYTTVPCVADWNGDGKKDLLVGVFFSGYIYLFLNSGTNSNPVLTAGSLMQADGAVISVPYG